MQELAGQLIGLQNAGVPGQQAESQTWTTDTDTLIRKRFVYTTSSGAVCSGVRTGIFCVISAS